MDNREGLHQYKNLKSIYEPYANLFIIQLSKGIIILNDVPGTNPKPKSQPPKTLNLRDQSKLITKENQIFGLWRLIPINKQDIPNFPQEINQSMKSSYLKDRLRKKKQHVPSSSSIEIDQIVVSIANLFGYEFVCLFVYWSENLFYLLKTLPFWCCLHTETESFCIGSGCVFIWLNRSYPTQTVLQINFKIQTKTYTIKRWSS